MVAEVVEEGCVFEGPNAEEFQEGFLGAEGF